MLQTVAATTTTTTTPTTIKTMSATLPSAQKIGEISLTNWNICRRCVVLYIYTSLFVTDVRRNDDDDDCWQSGRESNQMTRFWLCYLFVYANSIFNGEKCARISGSIVRMDFGIPDRCSSICSSYVVYITLTRRFVCVWSQMLSGHFHGVILRPASPKWELSFNFDPRIKLFSFFSFFRNVFPWHRWLSTVSVRHTAIGKNISHFYRFPFSPKKRKNCINLTKVELSLRQFWLNFELWSPLTSRQLNFTQFQYSKVLRLFPAAHPQFSSICSFSVLVWSLGARRWYQKTMMRRQMRSKRNEHLCISIRKFT